MKELIEIQNALKAPKTQYNKFGKYNYRNAEDILEAVKPILKEHGCTLTISDQIELIGERYYVKATAELINKNGEVAKTSAYAREDENGPNGMQVAQLTGSTSSYARKYALNGLFCIDDNKDPDAINTHSKDEQPVKSTPAPQPKKTEPKTKSTPAPQPMEEVTEQDVDSMVLDIMSSADLKEITKKWNAYKKYDIDKKITSAVIARRNELGV